MTVVARIVFLTMILSYVGCKFTCWIRVDKRLRELHITCTIWPASVEKAYRCELTKFALYDGSMWSKDKVYYIGDYVIKDAYWRADYDDAAEEAVCHIKLNHLTYGSYKVVPSLSANRDQVEIWFNFGVLIISMDNKNFTGPANSLNLNSSDIIRPICFPKQMFRRKIYFPPMILNLTCGGEHISLNSTQVALDSMEVDITLNGTVCRCEGPKTDYLLKAEVKFVVKRGAMNRVPNGAAGPGPSPTVVSMSLILAANLVPTLQ